MEQVPFHRRPSGLWVPGHPPPPGSRNQSSPPELEHTLITVGYEMIFDVRPTIDDVIERLRQYSLQEVVYFISRITLMLGRYGKAETRQEGQFRLAQAAFSEATLQDIMSALSQADPEVDWNVQSVLFHERQTANLLKVAFLVLGLGNEGSGDGAVEPLAEALLMMNDLIDPDPTEGASGEEAARRMELYVLANTLFNQGKSPLAEISRAHELFIDPSLRVEGAGELAERLERATGMPPDLSWFSLRALDAFFRTRGEEQIDAGTVSMSRSTGFGDFDFTTEELAGMFAVAALPARQLQQEIEEQYSLSDLRFFDVLPLARHPLVVFEDNVYCLSHPLLRDLAGMNIQYRFLDPNVFDERERDEFLRIRGRLFEDYLRRLLARTFGELRFVDDLQLKTVAGGAKSCDGIVVYPNGTIFLEFKAALTPLAVRTGESLEQYESRILQTVLDSADQIQSTIELGKQGKLVEVGVDPAQVGNAIPITVLMDPAQTHLMHRRLAEQLERTGVYTDPSILPFQVLSVDEMEMLETAVHEGRNVHDLLREKVADDATVGIPFNNYCHLQNEPWVGTHNPHLADRFRRISRELQTYLQSKKKEEEEKDENQGQQEQEEEQEEEQQ